jgi:hypothetical protein
MAALQRIRLEAAREEMLRAERAQSLVRIVTEQAPAPLGLVRK